MKSDILLVAALAPEAVTTLHTAFVPLGYHLHFLSDYSQTLPRLGQLNAEVVLVDISNPAANGLQVCGQIKAGNHAVKVIALYHQNEAYMRQAALAAGVDLVMPLLPEAAAIQRWLTQPSSTDAARLSAVLDSMTDDIESTMLILSHDLRSPISIIISTLEVLITMQEGDETTNSELRLLRGALVSAYRQMQLIGDMLDLLRLKLNLYELECHPCDLAGLVKDFIARQTRLLTIKGLRVEIEAPDVPATANVDVPLVERMLDALLDNVIKFTVHDDWLRIRVAANHEHITITFTDNGRPIFADFEKRIVEMAPRWRDREGGTRTSVALGLPFIYTAAQMQRGSFVAHIEPSTQHTTFILSFPTAKLAETV